MSQENVEVVRADVRAFTDRGAWRRGEYDQVFLEYCSADYELIPPPSYPDAATSYRGLERRARVAAVDGRDLGRLGLFQRSASSMPATR